jgi:hypothetical protein
MLAGISALYHRELAGQQPRVASPSAWSPEEARAPGSCFLRATTTSSTPIRAADAGGSCRSFVNEAVCLGVDGVSGAAVNIAGAVRRSEGDRWCRH